MGTYVELLKADGVTIRDDRKKEFEKRVEQLFRSGGMMEVRHIQLCGKTVNTIAEASMHEDGMNFFYNYFEDNRWENAGFDRNNCHVYSNKVGWEHFNQVIVAAYILEGLYLDGPAVAAVDGERVRSFIYADWIYYLFRDDCIFANAYKDAPLIVKPVTTAEFLEINPDDMILYWKNDGEVCFSDSLLEWFKELKDRFDQLKELKISSEKILEWILELMEYADENYYCVFTINDFFEETLKHLNDSRYIALWKVYDEMLHDPEMEKAGSVIFAPEGVEYEHIGMHYLGEQPRRRLLMNWDIMKPNKKNNRARVKFRRYMALVANKELRKKVFGF